MDFSLLGHMSLCAFGVTLPPAAPKPRQALALLLMEANQVVSVPTLIREIWDEAPPRSVLATMQTYILQLRKMLAAGLRVQPSQVSSRLLVTKDGGYVINTDPGTIDVFRFEQLARQGRAALARSENELATRTLREALALWRGEAFVDIRTGPMLQGHLVRLEEARLAALEYRIEADMRMGRHHELLPELAYLTAQHNLHESLHAQLMVALYRSGRRSEALDVFRRMRTRLIDQIGLEPSLRMQQVQRAILAADPILDCPCPHSALAADRFTHPLVAS